MDNINRNILVIDDNLTVCLMLKSWLVKKDFGVETASSVKEAKQKVKEQPFDLILCDIRMPDADGFDFLSWVKKYDSDILVIMMTGYADIESAVESMKSGAVDYISKPIEPEQLFKKIDEAFTLQERVLRQTRFSDDFIKFPSEEYSKLYKELEHTAENNQHRLIIGDPGTGKLSVVKYIYEKGIHLSKPFVILDNDKSADSANSYRTSSNGSDDRSPLMQKFQEAKGGLLYIRQTAYLDINQQNELLDILTRQKKDDDFTQVIMSTEISKDELQRRLIPKLYNLIIQDCIILPTLKGKKEAISFLANHFLQFANTTLDKKIEAIDPAVLVRLTGYAWPGNIQELKNCIIKAALLTEDEIIPASIVPELFGDKTKNENRTLLLNPIQGLRKEYYEKEKIIEALELAKGNKTMAASILNIDRKTLYNKIKLYNVLPNN
ncbi:two-component system, NtrC family, response regulator HydG [Porphyromonadaceae bacterium KH3R12]|uniref:sigma-54-dependent transcriptional regulator n=1 Tax=Proteiniphilum TaxID=294702 RepID=UPI000899CE2C|nr:MULTISPECIES: response regulator [Proteiniphilum]MDY9919000.1 response regulator [Proteiniphilum sp.]SDZ89244.1 two-component system, NtrC family, response regulator HydG [Porphyromonadaceae bacterium KH3R12]